MKYKVIVRELDKARLEAIVEAESPNIAIAKAVMEFVMHSAPFILSQVHEVEVEEVIEVRYTVRFYIDGIMFTADVDTFSTDRAVIAALAIAKLVAINESVSVSEFSNVSSVDIFDN